MGLIPEHGGFVITSRWKKCHPSRGAPHRLLLLCNAAGFRAGGARFLLVRGNARQLMLITEAAQLAGMAGVGPANGRPTCAVLARRNQFADGVSELRLRG